MNHRSITTALLAMLASLLFAASASAAPVLSAEMTRSPESINRGDEFASYAVKVKNEGPDPTVGTLNLAVALPEGLRLIAASGSGWSCNVAALSCTSSAAIAPGASYPTLSLSQVWIEEEAPDSVVVVATASGAGATQSASAQDSFSFGPRLAFGLTLTNAIAADEEGNDVTQAGAHPYRASAVFEIARHTSRAAGEIAPVEDLHGGVGEIPAGFVGNPEAANATCSFADLRIAACPDGAAVGGVTVFADLVKPVPDASDPLENVVYRLPHEEGYPASFGFKTIGPAFVVRAKIRSDGDYGITTVIPLVPQNPSVFGANFAFCGFGVKIVQAGSEKTFKSCKKRDDSDANRKAFLSLSTDCSIGKPLTRFAIDSWQRRGATTYNGLPDLSDPNWRTLDFHSPELTGCEQLVKEWTSNHAPTFGMQPDSRAADSPASYTANLHVPQDGLEDPEGLATAHLKDTTVTLPAGLSFNPAVAHRLEACSLEQIGYLGNEFPAPNKIRFDTEVPTCPEASKVGIAQVDTPVLADPLKGSVFLAAQKANPFGSDYAIYLSVEDTEMGIVAKLPGRLSLDPANGQITATFADNPQLPFEDLQLKFFGGDRSALANPVTCGTHPITTAFTPWSAKDPYSPRPDEIARPTDEILINSGANGAPCPLTPSDRPFDAGLSAGAKDPIAGARSPFSIRITRPDGSQELDRLEISPPPGFVASLKGIPYCTEAQIAAAAANRGRAEEASSSCPKASEVGSTYSGAGPGGTPFFAPGKLYLAGPYKGQSLSVVAVTPAVAGPFDLGNVVIRSALRINPLTARITALTDPIPQVFKGIPLRIRDIRIELDRPNWALNPTNCEAMSVNLTAYGSSGAVAKPSNRFQVGGCENLGFKPKLSILLRGGVKRGDNPALEAKLTTRPGDANIARAAVTLPHSAFLDQAHIRTICTRVQFAARQCPAGAVYGFARATTPLLDNPLEGNVLLRSSNNKLPDMVADLRGVADIEAVGRIDSVHGGIRSTFEVIPDAPFEVFTLKMQGGSKGLIVNSRNICAGVNRATVKLIAQNGRKFDYRPKVIAQGCKAKKASKKKRHHKKTS